jgi:gluconate kinase
MPTGLLHSQFETLEEPGADENPVTISIEASPREGVERILASLRSDGDKH